MVISCIVVAREAMDLLFIAVIVVIIGEIARRTRQEMREDATVHY